MNNMKLIGPFSQILGMADLPLKGPLEDRQLKIVEEGGVLVQEGKIKSIGAFKKMLRERRTGTEVEEMQSQSVLLPGFIDSHTHICFAGSRARDYAMRISGSSYQEILKQGGGIHETVEKTRRASEEELVAAIMQRAHRHLQEGVTTIEVKSGYGLNTPEELKMLRAIRTAGNSLHAQLIPTCLAAHVKPKDYKEASQYLEYVAEDLLPIVREENLSDRVDIFVEPEAFPAHIARPFLQKARKLGFSLSLHAEQFSRGGCQLAVEFRALSADHLEACQEDEITLLAASDTVATVLPGASLGLGMPFAPARKLLDAGACLAIATDWNPGSAPMGDLLLQAALLGAGEKLSMVEILAGITFRAAAALELPDQGLLGKGKLADMQAFPTRDYREILYFQGKMKATKVWRKGNLVFNT